MGKNYDVITFFSKCRNLKGPGVAIFADIIKIIPMFMKTIFKDSRIIILGIQIYNKKYHQKLNHF